MTDYFNELSKQLDQLGRRHELSTVFNDLLTLSLCSFHQTNLQSRLTEKDPDNEEMYLKIIDPYQPEEISLFSPIMGLLMLNVQDNPYTDLLGEYFMQQITHGQNGQFFTPEPVCQMMAAIQGDPHSIQGKRVLDPACGSGRLMLQFAKLNPDNYFFGADNSITCAKMTVLNFFLNGLRGEVAWMDSLSMEWYGGWQINTTGLGILPIEKEQSFIWTAPPNEVGPALTSQKPPTQKKITDSTQLTLF
ncbi:N-6 DNA methylase [Arsenicibacter rosenii]|uniref:site-specific DNA-methyltransferase (adenine-specific) n=1 Tax=Arsenicibacter rosenii TaxID=1750698 RepID=A0A1S2VG10_9BACT|nr:N-6 DNA methylase [Arsenicibacter rosenii]OIN57146.1 hypothetical protein BLX24_21590 [Arsenicibacter rosenii]